MSGSKGHFKDYTHNNHPPTLFCAFLHFDISFMVWVILGALMPFITTDATLTGANLRVTPTALVQRAGQYTLLIRGPQTVKQNPALKADQPKNVYNLLVKPGDPSVATRGSVKPVEKFVLDNADPATIAAVNAQSRFLHLEIAPGAHGNPNENVVALKPAAALTSAHGFQVVANGYPAGVKLT